MKIFNASDRLEGEAPMNSDLDATTWMIWCCRFLLEMVKVLVDDALVRLEVPTFGGGEVLGQMSRWHNKKATADHEIHD